MPDYSGKSSNLKFVSLKNSRKAISVMLLLFILLASVLFMSGCFETESKNENTFLECVISSDNYTWEYVDYEKVVGNRGTQYMALLVVRNNSNSEVLLVAFYEVDNGAMNSKEWTTSTIEPSSQWERNVSETVWNNGDNTYNKITKILLLSQEPECWHYHFSENSQAVAGWEENAVVLKPLVSD